MKTFLFLGLLVILASCGFHNLEGRVRPVHFSADAALFKDTSDALPVVSFRNVMGLSVPCLEVVDLRQGEVTTALISKPTFFQNSGLNFLVYPGESILVGGNDSNGHLHAFSTTNKNKARDRELAMLKAFQEMEKQPKQTRLFDYNIQTILDLESSIRNEIGPEERAAQSLFDSLGNTYRVSKRFKRLTRNYIHNRYDWAILALYQGYRDTLMAYHLYQDKLRAVLRTVNDITKESQFNLNVQGTTNYLYTCLFPDRGIRNMVTAIGGFQACFDSVTANFTGLARDYLLSRIMYRAYTQHAAIPSGYREKYYQNSINKAYRKIIDRAARQAAHSQPGTHLGPNEVLNADGVTRLRLEEVLLQFAGKYVLLDLWASWCGPCLEEMPALQELKKKYPADRIAFISVSLDRSIQAWNTRLRQLHSDSLTSYLLLNQDSAMLFRQIGLTTVPRYILYGKDGKIINADAPSPGDPELAAILDKLF